jgi:hypothetical protein
VLDPGDATVIVADDGQLPPLGAWPRTLPFTERDGMYWGVPGSDAAAIEELERQRAAGAQYLVVAWPAFWLLDHFSAFREHLRGTADSLTDDARLVVFDLAGPSRANANSHD